MAGLRLSRLRYPLVGALLAAALAVPGPPAAEGATSVAHAVPFGAAAVAAQAGEVLGFELGEERHYVMGPPEALASGEEAIWMIRLERMEGRGEERRAIFLLRHRRTMPRSIDDIPASGSITNAQVEAELAVNVYGGPLQLTFISQRHVFDVGDELFQITYRHHGREYKKEVLFENRDWELDIEIAEHPNLDPELPEGLFVFAPSAIGCIEWVVTAMDNAEACNELNTDPAFANPGLLSLVLPALWEARGDTEFVLFSPTRPDLAPGSGGGIPITFVPAIPGVPGVPGSGIIQGAYGVPGLEFVKTLFSERTTGDKDRARDPARYFRPSNLKLVERVRVAVGPRRMDALPLEFSIYPGNAYVDDWGKVLRIDINPDAPEEQRRWLRLLHASEY